MPNAAVAQRAPTEACHSAEDFQGVMPTTTVAAIDPAALYAQNCAGCHKRPPGASLAAATQAITTGPGGMPAFGDKLTPEQLAALAQWVANGGK